MDRFRFDKASAVRAHENIGSHCIGKILPYPVLSRNWKPYSSFHPDISRFDTGCISFETT